MAETTVKTRKVHSKRWHIIWRSIVCTLDGALALGGIIMIILGIISDYLPKKNSDNWTGNAAFQAATGMDYRWFGFILIACSVALMFLAFNVMAHHDASDKERELRRQERMKVLAASQETSQKNEQEAAVVTVTEKQK
ncbi:MAG: hypothetical protein MR990_04285 [Mollicutes bacterium]|nr:hypothetical protein [Mollicutes bacterium]MDD7043317.1 hypothetical protein [Mollicutes bacterium]MDY6070138.1 hypothetical protein [Bacilli bacterium]